MAIDMRFTPTRTSDGKKFDTWTLRAPGGRSLQVEVTHHAHPGNGYIFRAASRDPLLEGLSWEHTDIEKLRAEVHAEISEIVTRHIAADWAPAHLVEVSLYDTTENLRTSQNLLQLRLEIQDVRRDTKASRGNRGECRISFGSDDRTIIERGPDYAADFDPRDLSSDNMRVAREADDVRARAVIDRNADTHADLEALEETMRQFSRRLMERMAPDAVRSRGVPSPEDLVDLMHEAAELANHASRTASCAPDASGHDGPGEP